jgi:glycosyltransferase involved in cell wall biosynthesis
MFIDPYPSRSSRPPSLSKPLPFSRHTEPRVAIVTDTIDDLNGVAIGLRRLRSAAKSAGLPLWLVGPGDQNHVQVDTDGIVRLPSRFSRELALYRGMTWSLPFFLPLVRFLVDHEIALVQATTPGPMGMSAMAAARLLHLPVVTQHHTEVGAYAARLSGPALGHMADAIASSFYRRSELCLAPSRAAAETLRSYGVPQARIARVPRGVDLELFHPSRRDRASLARFGIADEPVIVYVGRFSREKNLAALLAAHRQLLARRPAIEERGAPTLLLIGEGPSVADLQGPRVIVAGPLRGEALATALASADVFAFPSETETFGNAVVEAQASGLAVVVAPSGAASENVVAGVTGIVAPPSRFADALGALLDDPSERARMGIAAHRHARRYDLTAAARGTFDLYRSVVERTVA